MNDDRLEGLIAPANAALLCNMLDIYSLNTLVTFLIDLELARKTIEVEPEPELTAEGQLVKQYAFDLSRATNLYLIKARELGTTLDNDALYDLLYTSTQWDAYTCSRWATTVLADQQIKTLLTDEGITDNG